MLNTSTNTKSKILRTKMNLLTYDLSNDIVAFSTKREGGVSCGAYSTFSICHYCGDNPENVARNRALLCRHLGIADNQLILPHQTHGTNIHVITSINLLKPTDLNDIDAVITNLPQCCIGVSTADCVPILLYDPTMKVIAAIHAGWRGTVAHIASKTIQQMNVTYGTNPVHIKAIIGPSISEEAFEIGDEVYDAFRNAGFSMPSIAHRYPAAGNTQKWHIDLWKANQACLESAGILPQNIFISGICTHAQHSTYFSARRLGIRSGRIFTGIMLK